MLIRAYWELIGCLLKERELPEKVPIVGNLTKGKSTRKVKGTAEGKAGGKT